MIHSEQAKVLRNYIYNHVSCDLFSDISKDISRLAIFSHIEAVCLLFIACADLHNILGYQNVQLFSTWTFAINEGGCPLFKRDGRVRRCY